MTLPVTITGPCPGVSPDRQEFEMCSTCDRRAVGYAESEWLFFDDGIKSEPAAALAPQVALERGEIVCSDYIEPLEKTLAEGQRQVAVLLRVKAAREAVQTPKGMP